MPESINWLHFSDLHLGLDGHSWLWPNAKHELFRDLKELGNKVDGWDLVFFTGDFTQSGKMEEFNRLNKELEELWQVLSKPGHTPQLCIVPGNHDMVRPDPTSSIAKALTRLWWTDPDMRMQFWGEPNCERRLRVREFFENYSNWSSGLQVPSIPGTLGELPGDFGATFRKGTVALGIIGLNSTFLQIGEGDYKGRLDLHVSQLNAVCESDPTRWAEQRTACVLLTHQPWAWLHPDALAHFRREIYPPERFLVHLCGHEHEPQTSDSSEAGGIPRRLRQAASLFGLEGWQGPDPKSRRHGYIGGQFVFTESSCSREVFWPRCAAEKMNGASGLVPDYRYVLRDGGCVVTSLGRFVEDDGSASGDLAIEEGSALDDGAVPTEGPALLEGEVGEHTARSRLECCPRFRFNAGPQHSYVRLEERSLFGNTMRESRCIWLVADSGVGKEGFLSSAVEQLRTQEVAPDVFHVRCDTAADTDAFEALFPQQFAMPLQTFGGFVGHLKGSFLLLDSIHPELASGEQFVRLKRIVNAMIDYCPDLHLILVCRLRPEEDSFPILALRHLDIPDTRTYMTHHPDATPQVLEADVIEQIHECSEGLPTHLDRVLRALSVSTLSSVLESEREGTSDLVGVTQQTPSSLVHTVAALASSEDPVSNRSFQLLKVLSVLWYGEVIESLRHYFPTRPFFAQHALQLVGLALLDVIPLQETSHAVSSLRGAPGEAADSKLLKVPRQVRDHVLGLLSTEEKEEIVLAGAERFFGREWREGKVKIRTQPSAYREYLSHGPGNEFAVIHHLVTLGRGKGDDANVRRSIDLGVQYARYLNRAERYRDTVLVAGALVKVVDRAALPEEWSRLAAEFGQGLRMVGKPDEALEYLNESMEIGESNLSTDERVSIWLQIALAQKRLGNREGALEASAKIRSSAKRKSGAYLHASVIIAEQTLDGDDLERELRRLEKRARREGYQALGDTISLSLARTAESDSEKIRCYDRVLENRTPRYNQTRAVVAKAQSLGKCDRTEDLKSSDLTALSASYSYLHAQRFSVLFDRCHEALWRVFERDGNAEALLRLFRHTSFLWRIRGEEGKETEYLKRLEKARAQTPAPSDHGLVAVELKYFLRRLQDLIPGTADSASKST